MATRPRSLVAERAVRFLRDHPGPQASRRLAEELLRTQAKDEGVATRILEAAFSGDPRLAYGRGGWRLARRPEGDPPDETDRALILIHGHRPEPGLPFQLENISIVRVRGDDIVAACGGDVTDGRAGSQLRRAVRDVLQGAVPILHDAPASLSAFERWLDESLEAPISLRRLGRDRLGLRAGHDFEALAEHLGLRWRDTDDPVEQADLLDTCLDQLRRPDESLYELRVASASGAPPIDWSRFSFDREFVRKIPRVPGTYRFFDGDDRLLYVGKSKNLHDRIGSYLREGSRRTARVQQIVDRLRRIEYEASGSELEAMLREAEQIRLERPERNVQLRVHSRPGRENRLRSILILEQAEPPNVLRAYLIREGRLVARVAIGPRGGGLARIERVLDDRFFFCPDGPTPTTGPDLDVEVVVRWLAANRDCVVAFDPTDLGSAREVTDRLRWFLAQGTPFDADGDPVRPV